MCQSDGLFGFEFLGFLQLQGILDTLRGDEDSVEAIVFDEEQLSLRQSLVLVFCWDQRVSRTVLGPPSLRSRPVFFLPVHSESFLENSLKTSWGWETRYWGRRWRGAGFDCKLKKETIQKFAKDITVTSKMDRLHSHFFCHACFHLFGQIIVWVFALPGRRSSWNDWLAGRPRTSSWVRGLEVSSRVTFF